ncbi:MAG: helix-turn-helix domain-containing protein [Thermoplasmataceae archaeon]
MIELRGLKLGQVEAVIEVIREDCAISRALSDANCHTERINIGPNTTVHKISFDGDGLDIKSCLTRRKIKYRNGGVNSLWAEVDSCSTCAFFAKSFAAILGTRSLGNNTVQYRVLLPSMKDLKTLESNLKKEGIDYNSINVYPYVHQELTERQRSILRIAMEHGYFDEDNRTSLTELAERLDMAPSSLSEILRRSMKKVVMFYFDHLP